MATFSEVNGSRALTVATASAWVIGWVVIGVLYAGTHLFPNGDSAIALGAFWFALVLFLNALYVLLQLVWSTRPWTVAIDLPVIWLWLVPFVALAIGLAFARKFWSR